MPQHTGAEKAKSSVPSVPGGAKPQSGSRPAHTTSTKSGSVAPSTKNGFRD